MMSRSNDLCHFSVISQGVLGVENMCTCIADGTHICADILIQFHNINAFERGMAK